MRLFRVGLYMCAAVMPIMAANAQSAPAGGAVAGGTTTPAGASPVETVVVSAYKPTVQVLPDRTVYSLDKNIQSITGSISDVLRDLPSVDVDILGNVSLRGDANVTVLIDGKKSPLLAGSLADALQQLPADMVESIEVITNPSAEFRAEGSAGIINIVLRKDRDLVASGLARVSVGDQGRFNASVSGNFKIGKVNVHGSYGERRDTQDSAASIARSDGTAMRSSQNIASQSVNSGRHASLSARVNVTAQDDVDLGGSYHGFHGTNTSDERNVSYVNGTDTERDGLSRWDREGAGITLNYRHKFATKDEEFNIDTTRFTSWGLNTSDYATSDVATDTTNFWQSRVSKSRDAHTEFKTGYVLPFGERDKVKVGYSLENDNSQTDNRGFERDSLTADWAVDTSFLNDFQLDRTIHSGYVSYEQHFGPFALMGGLRVEQDYLHTDLKTTGEVHDTSSLGVFPSVHLSYNLTDTQMVRLSYSRRTNRPGAGVLNPARYSSDAFNVRAGNPLLKPEQVDSFEASYRYMSETVDAVMTGYYRATYKGITSVYRYLSNSVLLTTQDNLARRMASGVETNLNIRIIPGVSIKSNAMLAYSEFNPGETGAGTRQSGLNYSIKGGAEWQIDRRDVVQLNANYSGKQRFAQGYRQPTLSGDFAFKHVFGGGVTGVFTLNNLFNSWNRNSVLDSAGLHQVEKRTMRGRRFYLGLVYAFGETRQRDRDGERQNEGEEGTFQGGI